MLTHPNLAHRQAAIDWARALLANPSFVVLDTETTGIGQTDEVVAIGVIDGRGDVLMDTLVRPRKAISREAMQIHGIDNRDVDKAPRFAEVYPRLAEVVTGRALVVFNLDFDWRMLRRGCTSGGQPALAPASRHCAMKQYAQFSGDWNANRQSYRWKSLAVACGHFGIPAEAAHSALGDCRLTLAVIQHMAAAG